jgi:hypothetical protein
VAGLAASLPCSALSISMTPTSFQHCRNETIQDNANRAGNGRQQAERGCLGELEMNALFGRLAEPERVVQI